MRAIWNGSINFGLVNIPVQLFSGANPREGIDLDMLHKEDHAPIRYARICRKDGEEIPWGDIVKGYEYRDGDYVVLTKKDLDLLDSKKTQTISIEQFASAAEVDVRYYEKPYYLEPVKGGEKAYALLRQALQKSKKLAIATFVIHQREHLAAILPLGNALVLAQMRFPSDLRQATELHFPTGSDVSKKEIEMALDLIEQETRPFIPEDYHDTFTEELEALIKDKTKGKKPHTVKHTAEPAAANDLMASLKASLKK